MFLFGCPGNIVKNTSDLYSLCEEKERETAREKERKSEGRKEEREREYKISEPIENFFLSKYL